MANEPNEDEPLFHAATYTQAPKVSHKVLTKEERQVLIKQHEEKQQEAAHLDQVASKGPIGRWWSRLQSGPNRITPAMAIVALGVVYGDIGTSPLYTRRSSTGRADLRMPTAKPYLACFRWCSGQSRLSPPSNTY
ncbi:conserved hypothetical protein [Bifidobacterium catenulatum subsp. kashiwanohense JCM 15439 = DSM 21854]|nr:conserved hypothetical protein [Bifidobacterium catenulatum subsp. kashiwanohense JCM 15439 = DSM 21854]